MVKPAATEQDKKKPVTLDTLSVEELPDDVPTPRSRMKNSSIDLPDYLLRELKIRAAHRDTSIRHVFLTSLKLEGFEIRDADTVVLGSWVVDEAGDRGPDLALGGVGGV